MYRSTENIDLFIPLNQEPNQQLKIENLLVRVAEFALWSHPLRHKGIFMTSALCCSRCSLSELWRWTADRDLVQAPCLKGESNLQSSQPEVSARLSRVSQVIYVTLLFISWTDFSLRGFRGVRNPPVFVVVRVGTDW